MVMDQVVSFLWYGRMKVRAVVRRMRVIVVPVISFIAEMVAWRVTRPLSATVENCSLSNELFPVALATAVLRAWAAAAIGLVTSTSCERRVI